MIVDVLHVAAPETHRHTHIGPLRYRVENVERLDLVRGQRSDLLLRPFDGVTVIRTGEQSLMETEHRQVMTRNRRLAGRLLAAAMVAETAEQDVEQIGPRLADLVVDRRRADDQAFAAYRRRLQTQQAGHIAAVGVERNELVAAVATRARVVGQALIRHVLQLRSEEHPSELPSIMRISSAV